MIVNLLSFGNMSPEYSKLITYSKKYNLLKYPSPIAKVNLQNQELLIKHEDQLDLGCAKQRSLILWIENKLQEGIKKFCISTSGNSGFIALFLALNNPEIEEMIIFLSDQISDLKLEKIKALLAAESIDTKAIDLKQSFSFRNIQISFSPNPKQLSMQYVSNGFYNLRGSTGDEAVKGFRTISEEIETQSPQIDEIFIPASSGTTAAGIYKGFAESFQNKVKFNIVQTTKVFALVKKFQIGKFQVEETHPSESIVDFIGHRRIQIEEIINQTQGSTFTISSKQTLEAQDKLNAMGIKCSTDSALTYAAWEAKGRPSDSLLIFTG